MMNTAFLICVEGEWEVVKIKTKRSRPKMIGSLDLEWKWGKGIG